MGVKDDGLDELKDGNKDLPIKENTAPAASPEAATAELTSLRHQVVAQAAELATIRWHMNTLLSQQRILELCHRSQGIREALVPWLRREGQAGKA